MNEASGPARQGVGTTVGPRRHRAFPNPFYVALLVVSTLFVATALAYWVGPMVALKAQDDPGVAAENPATPRMIAWLDRHAPTLLTLQFSAMVVLSVAAMATDQWFSTPRRGRRGRAQNGRGDLAAPAPAEPDRVTKAPPTTL